MSGIATAVIAGAVISSVASNKASKKAARAQEAGINTATGEQRRQFDITGEDLASAEEQNRADIIAGRTGSIASQREGFVRQRRELDPFARAGRGALEQQQALLGLGSPEEQQAAFNQFAESPGQRFIRERAQKNLLRNSSAIGGLGGGNVRSALVEQGAGFAAQDFNNQFNRLSDIRTAGQNAATNIGQGALSTGTNVGATRFNAGQLLGAGAINTAARQGQFGQNFATNVGNLAVQGGNVRATGIQNQNAALQQGIAGVTTSLAQSGLFTSTPPPSSTANIGIT